MLLWLVRLRWRVHCAPAEPSPLSTWPNAPFGTPAWAGKLTLRSCDRGLSEKACGAEAGAAIYEAGNYRTGACWTAVCGTTCCAGACACGAICGVAA